MSPRPDIAWSRQLAGTSPGQVALWAGAAALMFSAHASAGWWLMRETPAPYVQEAGSAVIEVDLAALGFTVADQVSAGEMAEEAEPVESRVAEAVGTETSEVQEVTPVETARAVETPPVEEAEPVTETPRPQPAEVQPREPVRAEAVPSPAARLAEASSQVEIAALPPTERETAVELETARPVEVEAAEPVEEELEVAAIVHVPLPTPRPDYTPPAPRVERQRTEQPRREQPAPQQQQRRAAGSGGQNQTDARRGTAQGSTQGRAATQSAGDRRNTAAGNAAVSNYPGQVAQRLRRAVRPQRGRDRGEVLVSFTVSRSGGVSAVRVARGSGSANLDKAALDTVHRAAPFPPIPDAAGRSSWTFNLPLAFTR